MGLASHEISIERLTEARDLGLMGLNWHYKDIDPASVKLVHDYKLQLFAYTVNNFKSVMALRTMGVDGVVTNYPDRLRSNFVTNR